MLKPLTVHQSIDHINYMGLINMFEFKHKLNSNFMTTLMC